MEKNLLIFTVVFVLNLILSGCSKKEAIPIDIISPDPMEEYYFVELGLKPTQRDKINEILLFKEYDDCYLLGGQRNNHAWFSKLDKQGNEIYSWEALELEDKKYSLVQQDMIAFENNNFLFLKIIYSNNNYPYWGNDKNYKEFLSIIDFQDGEEIDAIRPQTNVWNYSVRENNGRYLIGQDLAITVTGNFADCEHYYYVAGKNGKILYGGEYDDENFLTFSKGIIFIDDEIVVPQVNDKTKFFSSSYYLPIVNLKAWKVICKIDESLGLMPKGDYLGE